MFFDGGKVSHIYPLYGFLCRVSGTAQVETVVFAHHFHVFQCLDLFCHFFAQTDTGICHRTGEVVQIFLLCFDQTVDAVKSHTAVVTDDASACIIVGKSGKESQRTEGTDFFRIYVEYSVVVRLAVVSENIFYAVVHFHAVFVTGFADYVDTSERLDGTFQKFVCLQADDQFVFLVDISGLVGSDG